jgi:hypothetical protein
MARILSQEMTENATASAASSTSAARQTPRSRRVSRSRSNGTEAGSATTSERKLGILVISRLGWKAPLDRWVTGHGGLARGLWIHSVDRAKKTERGNSVLDNRCAVRYVIHLARSPQNKRDSLALVAAPFRVTCKRSAATQPRQPKLHILCRLKEKTCTIESRRGSCRKLNLSMKTAH